MTRAVAIVPTLAVAFLTAPTAASSEAAPAGGGGGNGGSTALDGLNQVLNLLQSVQLPFA